MENTKSIPVAAVVIMMALFITIGLLLANGHGNSKPPERQRFEWNVSIPGENNMGWFTRNFILGLP